MDETAFAFEDPSKWARTIALPNALVTKARWLECAKDDVHELDSVMAGNCLAK